MIQVISIQVIFQQIKNTNMKTIKLLFIFLSFSLLILGQGKNRTSYQSQVSTDLPSGSGITAAELRAHLITELAENIRFRLDDASTQNKTSGTFSIDFDGVDQIITTITGTSGSTVTINNLEDGDIKYWVVNKSATETISFSGATDISAVQDYITAATKVIYRITYKNTTIIVEALLKNVQTATETIEGILEIATSEEADALTATDKIITPDNLPISTSSQQGLIETATVTEAKEQNLGNPAVTPSGLGAAFDGLCSKIIDIGDWDMNASSNVLVAHGNTLSKIRGINVLIRNDADTQYETLFGTVATGDLGGYAYATSTNIVCVRTTGGRFDNTTYDATSYNRGWIIMWYDY